MGLPAKVEYCSVFEIQSRYYVHFQSDSLDIHMKNN